MSDDDLIRRGDVLREIANEGLHILDAAIAALPARGVEVKDARDALEELANMPLGIPLEDWARLSARILAAFAPTDAATQKGGDAHDRRLRSHEASPGVTAGADAAQAREAALPHCVGEAALEHMLDRKGIKHLLSQIKEEDPEVWREICEETGRAAIRAIGEART